MIMSTGRMIAVVGASALVVGLSGCTREAGSAPEPPATITIGVLAAGDAAKGGELAVEVVNNQYRDLSLPLASSAGLSRGTKLVLATGDAKGDPAAAGQAAEQLVRQSKAAGVVVADTADVAKAASQRAEDALFPLLDAGSSADFLGDLGREWYFRIGPTDRMLLSTAFDALRQAVPPDANGAGRRLVVLDGATGQPAGGAPDLTGIAGSRRFTVLGRLPVAAGANPAELADKITAQKPDAVVALVGSEPEATTASDALQRLKPGVPAVAVGHGIPGGANARFLQRAVGWSSDFAGRSPAAKAVGDLYQRKYGAPMSDTAASTFTAVLTLAVAIDRVGGTDASQIRAKLRQMWLPATATIMPWDGVQFGASGQNELAGGVVERKADNGAFRVVYPRELAPRGTS